MNQKAMGTKNKANAVVTLLLLLNFKFMLLKSTELKLRNL